MKEVSSFLTERLQGFTRLAVLGVGSVLRADDAAGMEVVRRMEERDRALPPEVRFFAGETAPENFSGSIKRFAPSHLLIVDAADVGLYPGEFQDINPADVGGPSFLSHMLPLKIMVDYLAAETGAQVTLLGIQYRTLTFDGPMSQEVEAAVQTVCEALEGILYPLEAGLA